MTLSPHRRYDYRNAADQPALDAHVRDWPAIRTAGRLRYVLRYGMLRQAPYGYGFAGIAAFLAPILDGRGLPSLRPFLLLLLIPGTLITVVAGTFLGLRLWRYNEAQFEYAVVSQTRAAERAMSPTSTSDLTWQLKQAPAGDVHGGHDASTDA